MFDSVLVCCRPNVFQISGGFTRDVEGCAGRQVQTSPVQTSARDICERHLFIVSSANDDICMYGCMRI